MMGRPQGLTLIPYATLLRSAMTAMTLMQRYIREQLSSVMEKIMTVMELQPTALENPGMELPVMGLIQTSAKRELMAVQVVLRSVQTARAIQQRSAPVVWMRTVIRQLTVDRKSVV